MEFFSYVGKICLFGLTLGAGLLFALTWIADQG